MSATLSLFVNRARSTDDLMRSMMRMMNRVIFARYVSRGVAFVAFKPVSVSDPLDDAWFIESDCAEGFEPVETWQRHTAPAVFYTVRADEWDAERALLDELGFVSFEDITDQGQKDERLSVIRGGIA